VPEGHVVIEVSRAGMTLPCSMWPNVDLVSELLRSNGDFFHMPGTTSYRHFSHCHHVDWQDNSLPEQFLSIGIVQQC
jgi:hypothetical protein